MMRDQAAYQTATLPLVGLMLAGLMNDASGSDTSYAYVDMDNRDVWAFHGGYTNVVQHSELLVWEDEEEFELSYSGYNQLAQRKLERPDVSFTARQARIQALFDDSYLKEAVEE